MENGFNGDDVLYLYHVYVYVYVYDAVWLFFLCDVFSFSFYYLKAARLTVFYWPTSPYSYTYIRHID